MEINGNRAATTLAHNLFIYAAMLATINSGLQGKTKQNTNQLNPPEGSLELVLAQEQLGELESEH